jgi:signal transduction histidine kinase
VSGLLATVAGFFEPVADENGVELVVEPHAPLSVPGDPSWLHQLFANLIHNAIKYTPRGGRVAISMGREPGRVCVVVRDNGVGIDQAEADQIFERFNRGRSGGTLPGVGLGLTIAREIARAHGGSIEVASEPGQGSTFSVRLPLSAHRGSPS